MILAEAAPVWFPHRPSTTRAAAQSRLKPSRGADAWLRKASFPATIQLTLVLYTEHSMGAPRAARCGPFVDRKPNSSVCNGLANGGGPRSCR